MSTNPLKKGKTAKSAATPTYTELHTQLDHILAELQRDDLDVDDALRYYQQGIDLVQQLERYLETAQNTITELQAKANPQSP